MNLQHVKGNAGQGRPLLTAFMLAALLAFCWAPSTTKAQTADVVPEIKEPQGEQEAEDCVKCHMKVNPALVAMFQASTMGKEGVQNREIYEEVKQQRAPKEETETRKGFLVRKGQITCVLCHGNDHSTITETNGRVADAVCGGCHDAIDKEYVKGGGHTFDEPAQSWARALDNPEFAGLPLPVLQLSRDLRFSQQGATEPPYYDHDPDYERSDLVLRNGCDSCHTRHLFSAAEARKPEACKTCHAGAGDSVFDSYRQSKHGSIYDAHGKQWDWEMSLPEAFARGEYKAPTCAYCHMLIKDRYGSVTSTHDMTRKGIWNRGLQPLVVDETRVEEGAYREYLRQMRLEAEPRRAEMVLICRNCHSEKFAQRFLNAADQVKLSSDLLVLKARSIVDQLIQQAMLPAFPIFGAPVDESETPASGQEGAPASHEATTRHTPSAIERTYLEMARYHNVRTSRGAFHQSPEDVLWGGYVVLEDELNRIRGLAERVKSKQQR